MSIKKGILFIIPTLFLWGCFTTSQYEPDSVKTTHELTIIPNAESSETYKEIEVDLMVNSLDVTNYIEVINQEVKRLQKEGWVFWHNSEALYRDREPMIKLDQYIDCDPEGKSGPCMTYIGTGFNTHLPNVQMGQCIPKLGFCSIAHPQPPNQFISSMKMKGEVYLWGEDYYFVASKEGDDQYGIYKNTELIFENKMYLSVDGITGEAVVVQGKPAFAFYGKSALNNDNKVSYANNIFYEGETLNEKYDLEGSSYLFSYKDKIGLVGQKDGKAFIFLNNQKVSEDFDKIITNACCMFFKYPIQVDENGILFFMAERGGKYYFVEVNLNKYL